MSILGKGKKAVHAKFFVTMPDPRNSYSLPPFPLTVSPLGTLFIFINLKISLFHNY